MHSSNKPTERGFSLIEVVIVVTIIGIIATIAVPKFADAGSGRRLSAAQKVLRADIATAKLRARATSKVHAIKFYPDDEYYVIIEGTTVKPSAIIIKRDLSADPYRVGIKRTSLGVVPYSIITPFGDLSPAFSVTVDDQGIEIPVSFDGIASTGLTVVDTVVDIQDLGLGVSQ